VVLGYVIYYEKNHCEHIIRCLHVHNDHIVIVDWSNVEFDKLVKSKWLFEEIRYQCKDMLNMGDKVTIDKVMIQYKSKHCNIVNICQ